MKRKNDAVDELEMVKRLEIVVYVFFFITSDEFVGVLRTNLTSNNQYPLTENSSVECTTQQV